MTKEELLKENQQLKEEVGRLKADLKLFQTMNTHTTNNKVTVASCTCEHCGKKASVDTSMVLTSYPPQYNYHCPHCGHNSSITFDKVVYETITDAYTYHNGETYDPGAINWLENTSGDGTCAKSYGYVNPAFPLGGTPSGTMGSIDTSTNAPTNKYEEVTHITLPDPEIIREKTGWGKVAKPIITKRCAICDGSIDPDSPEIVCTNCKGIII